MWQLHSQRSILHWDRGTPFCTRQAPSTCRAVHDGSQFHTQTGLQLSGQAEPGPGREKADLVASSRQESKFLLGFSK